MADNYTTQITITKSAAQWLREHARRYGLGVAGVVRVLLINAMEAGLELPDDTPTNGTDWDRIQIGVSLEVVRQFGDGIADERALERTRAACKHVIQIAYEGSLQNPERHSLLPLYLFPATSSSAA